MSEAIERAKQEVFAICKGRYHGGHEWRMRRDSDRIIMAGLNAVDALVKTAVAAELKRCIAIADSFKLPEGRIAVVDTGMIWRHSTASDIAAALVRAPGPTA